MGKCLRCGRETSREYFYYHAEPAPDQPKPVEDMLTPLRTVKTEYGEVEKRSAFYCRRCVYLAPAVCLLSAAAALFVLYFLTASGSSALTLLLLGGGAASLAFGLYELISFLLDRPDSPETRAAHIIALLHPSVRGAGENANGVRVYFTPSQASLLFLKE